MAKPDDIPQDVWDAAAWYVGTSDHPDIHRQWIARAILAERERCALVCEAYGRDIDPQTGDWLAEKIRRG